MSSVQSALMSQPLPLSDAFAGNHTSAKPALNDQEKAAKDFESVFTTMLMSEMRKTLEPGSLFSEDTADVYGGLFDQFIGQHIADAGGIGLAKMVRESLGARAGSPQLPAANDAQRADATKADVTGSTSAKPGAVGL